jgi:hypothetical protein
MTAADPEGRVRHLLDVMHKTFDAAGDPIAAGMVPIADGLGQVDYVDSSTFGGGLPWFIVTAYGAVNDGSTNDRAAINAAIAALNSAGGGVLYFPAGTGYATTGGGLTPITVPCLVMGDGSSEIGAGGPSILLTDHATANFLDITGDSGLVKDIIIKNTAASPSAGSGIRVMGSSYSQVNFENVVIRDFYIDIDSQTNVNWFMRGCLLYGPVLYALKIRNTVNVDAGDWTITESLFAADVRNATSAIRIESSGGGKIIGCKINKAANTFTTGVDLTIAGSANDTSILLIGNTSIENVTGDAISLVTTTTGRYAFVTISGCQVGLYSNNTGRAVSLNAAAVGTGPTAGTISHVVIDSSAFHTDGTARAAIGLTNGDDIVIGDLALSGFNARYTSSGTTNITDGSAISYATPAIVLGTAAAAGAASTVIRSDSTIVAFDATVPTTQAFGDAAATGSAAVAARRDHVHGMPATPSSSAHYLVIASSHSTPLIFGDIVQNSAQNDLVYTT